MATSPTSVESAGSPIDLARFRGRLFLTVTEVSGITNTDPRTVRRAIDEGTIPARRLGKAVRVPAALFWPQVCGLDPTTLRPLTTEHDPGNSEAGASPAPAIALASSVPPPEQNGLANVGASTPVPSSNHHPDPGA